MTANRTKAQERNRERHILVLTTPALWGHWPFLPVVRRTRGEQELGLLCDLLGVRGQTGYSAAVYLGNLFRLPPTLDEFLELPKEVYDTAEELFLAGWRVD